MNGEDHRTISNIHTEITRLDAATSTSNPFVEDVGPSTRTNADDITLLNSNVSAAGIDNELYVLHSNSVAEPPSEIAIKPKRILKRTVLKKNTQSAHDGPSTSKDHRLEIMPSLVEHGSESLNEVQMMDINLQSDNDINIDSTTVGSKSIVLAYLKNKNLTLHSVPSTTRTPSLLESVPKMETIMEGERPAALPSDNADPVPSDSSLDVRIPSFPGSLRSLHYQSEDALRSRGSEEKLGDAVDFIHTDHDFLLYAEKGDDVRLERCIRNGVDIHDKDETGRTALHYAVQTDNMRAITLLLEAGARANDKDSLAMTPLILCLMRRPSLRVANLLFDYGAQIPPRSVPIESGLLLQFVMMCLPTSEEAKILNLLIDKGALINDPEVPGGRSALHFAAMSNNCALIRVLIPLGADVLAVNHRGQTPLDVATTFHSEEAAQLLEEYVKQEKAEYRFKEIYKRNSSEVLD